MKINPEFKKLIPPLSGEELAGLEASISAEGIREPVILWGDIIIDGHNRYEIGSRLGLEVPSINREFADENAVKRWMIENQFGRRNLSAYQRGLLALEYKGLIAERAKANQLATLKQNTVLENSPERGEPINTRLEVAKIAGISDNTISRIEKIKKEV